MFAKGRAVHRDFKYRYVADWKIDPITDPFEGRAIEHSTQFTDEWWLAVWWPSEAGVLPFNAATQR